MRMRKYILLASIFAGLCCTAEARNYRSYDERANHFITLSLGAGESNTLSQQEAGTTLPKVTDALGADALLGAGYELRYHGFILGLQAQLDYDLTRQSLGYFSDTRTGYIDNVYGSDGIRQTDLSYIYMYDSYVEAQNHLQGSGQLYVGGNLGRYVYLLAGAKFSSSFYSGYHTNIMLSTTKVYKDVIDNVVGTLSDRDGAYSTHSLTPRPSYHYTDPAEDANALRANPFRFKVSPMVEVGARLPVTSFSGRVGMRLGVYAEWAIPVMNSSSAVGSNLVVYDQLEARRHEGFVVIPESREKLDQLILTNSILNTNLISHASPLSLTQLTVGIKWTVLFNVTAPKHFCIICED